MTPLATLFSCVSRNLLFLSEEIRLLFSRSLPGIPTRDPEPRDQYTATLANTT